MMTEQPPAPGTLLEDRISPKDIQPLDDRVVFNDFEKAKPVWLKGLSEEMNIQAGFRAEFKAVKGVHVLRITGSTIYRITLNGAFLGHGPARCGHGVYRVDEWVLPVISGSNLLAVEVAGYNADSYAYLDQPSFLQAEVIAKNRVLAATGTNRFTAFRLRERVRKIQRYSYQRAFAEAYRLSPRSSDWSKKLTHRRKPHEVEVMSPRRFVPRGVDVPAFETRQPVAVTARGTLRLHPDPELSWTRAWNDSLEDFKAFPADRKTLFPLHELQSFLHTVRTKTPRVFLNDKGVDVKEKSFQVLDFGTNLTGFIGLRVKCEQPVDLYLCFDEIAMENGDVSLTRYKCCNIVKYSLTRGQYDLETFEPYQLRFLKLLSLNGSCRVSGVYLREIACPDAQRAHFSSSDPRLNKLFEAARQSFRQNAVDLYMDCPGRERAGWLCDSFFTARAERDLCGHNRIERNFLENFALPGKFPDLPKGMLPMCYPSDHRNGTFIPNWAMWFVIELEEYLARTGDRSLVDALQKRVYELIDYFKPFLNSDGLLESLEKWVFLEWSKANAFTQDVSYPSNMVYAGMLAAAGRLFGDPALEEQANQMCKVIRKQSFDGQFFVDNAVRKADGTLEVTRNRTETCQYYAFFFGIATPKRYPDLWKMLLCEFGPDRDPDSEYPDIHPSNAFIGFFLRLEVLSRYKQSGLILDQLMKYYLPMAERTGTLWEHKDTSASCNHGFAGHVAHIIYRDILGVRCDPQLKTIRFEPTNVDLDWCRGLIPVGHEWIEASWEGRGSKQTRNIQVPIGYRLESD